jgi:hypothetical protein
MHHAVKEFDEHSQVLSEHAANLKQAASSAGGLHGIAPGIGPISLIAFFCLTEFGAIRQRHVTRFQWSEPEDSHRRAWEAPSCEVRNPA